MAAFTQKTFTKHDDYMTPKYAWENIKEYIPKKIIWEAFYGDGNSGTYLRELGFDVIHQKQGKCAQDKPRVSVFLFKILAFLSFSPIFA